MGEGVNKRKHAKTLVSIRNHKKQRMLTIILAIVIIVKHEINSMLLLNTFMS